MDKSNLAEEVYRRLKKIYPDAVTFLNYKSPFELLIAVILSAQTTDAQVNMVTSELFRKFPDPMSLMNADQGEVEIIIRSTGFFRVKARNIIGAAGKLVVNFNSEVPDSMDALLAVPGVGRKSANVIRAHCFDKPAVIVDTHFARVSRRLGLTNSSNPYLIEKDLQKITDPAIQTDFSMVINIHGRNCCRAKKPLCSECVLSNVCSYRS